MRSHFLHQNALALHTYIHTQFTPINYHDVSISEFNHHLNTIALALHSYMKIAGYYVVHITFAANNSCLYLL